MQVEVLKVEGIDVVLDYVGLPVDHKHRTKRKALNTLSKLVGAGDEHAKLCRMIIVWMRVTAPRYWWQQCDTYSIGASGYSESTMHTILDAKLTQDNFAGEIPQETIARLNSLIEEEKFYQVKRELPESFLQTRLKMFSYQTLRRIWKQRRGHKLPEWQKFIKGFSRVPYSGLLIFQGM